MRDLMREWNITFEPTVGQEMISNFNSYINTQQKTIEFDDIPEKIPIGKDKNGEYDRKNGKTTWVDLKL